LNIQGSDKLAIMVLVLAQGKTTQIFISKQSRVQLRCWK